MPFAWTFGALLEGLAGFGYPRAAVAPILISLSQKDLDALRVAAVIGYPLLGLSGSAGTIVTILSPPPTASVSARRCGQRRDKQAV
jgi:L-lactate permease